MRRLCIGGFAAAMLLALGPASIAAAAPVVTQAAGANAAAITPAVNQFGNDLGTLNGGGPPAPSGRRQIVWDGVPAERQSPAFMPENQFRNVGALFSTPTLTAAFQVSGLMDDFANLNASYGTAFDSFSMPRTFAPIGSTITDTTFVVPGSTTAAQTNGFGVVFTDVDVAGSASIQLFDANNNSLGTFPVPPAGNSDATFSFLGVIFNAGERIARARIVSGAAPLLEMASPNDITQAGPADLVVMDNFIFGEPQLIPPPPPVPPLPPTPPAPPPPLPDTQRPQVTLRGAPQTIRLRALLRSGIRVRLTPNEPVSFRGTLLASVRSVRVARNELTLVSRGLGRAAGTRTLRLRPNRRLLRNAPRRFRMQLVVQATDAVGLTRTLRRTIQVRR
jgi:hypothetical protein